MQIKYHDRSSWPFWIRYDYSIYSAMDKSNTLKYYSRIQHAGWKDRDQYVKFEKYDWYDFQNTYAPYFVGYLDHDDKSFRYKLDVCLNRHQICNVDYITGYFSNFKSITAPPIPNTISWDALFFTDHEKATMFKLVYGDHLGVLRLEW